jgi:hypothetical protein
MTRRRRVIKVTLLTLIGLFFLSGLFDSQLDLWWRIVTLVGLISSVLAIRTVLGAVLIVSDKGLRVQKAWPHRRDISWYRILATDVIPGFWNLELELNSGERVELPPVADINALYDDIERHRTALDA